MKNTFSSFWILVGISAALGEITTNYGCNLPTNCGDELSKDLHDTWYNDKPSLVYTHEFTIVQTSSIQTTNWKEGEDGEEVDRTAYKDNQTAIIRGILELVRGTGNMSCSASFIVKNATIQFQDAILGHNESNDEGIIVQPLVLNGPTVFPFIFYNRTDAENLGDISIQQLQSICVPHDEDVWETNLRRSLVFMLTSNLYRFTELKNRNSDNFEGILGDEANLLEVADVFGDHKEDVTNYAIWNSRSSNNLTKLRLMSHSKDTNQIRTFKALSREIDRLYKNASVVEDVAKRTDAVNHENFSKRWLTLLDPYSSFGLTSCQQTLSRGMVESAVCREYQRIFALAYLGVDMESTAEIRIIPSPITYKVDSWNLDNMKQVSAKFDPLSNASASSYPAIVLGFKKLMVEFCENTENPRALLNYEVRMRRILPIVRVQQLKEQYGILKEGNHCGLHGFLQIVASTPSDDTVEFMVELITNADRGVNSDVFTTFLWTSTMMPTVDNDDFQRYAGSRSHTALQSLMDSKQLYHRKYGMSDSQFLLHMVGLLNKERKLVTFEFEDILPRVSYILEMDKFMTALDNGTEAVDRATRLQMRKGVEKYGQQLDPDNDDELEDDFERLMTHNPCSGKHEKYLKQLFEDGQKRGDLKIMAYLFMRKCYIPAWRELVTEYVSSDQADKEVVNFIIQHVDAISESYKSHAVAEDEEKLIVAANLPSVNVSSELGSTIFHTFDYDPKIYGKTAVRKMQIGVELNIVKGNDRIPRLLTMEIRSFMNGEEENSAEVEIIRLKSPKSGNSEILLTHSQSGVTTYTTIIEVDQSKLFQLLQDGSDSALVEFIRTFSFMNRGFLSQIFQNRKIESLKRIMLRKAEKILPSLSGFPIKTHTTSDVILSFNFTHQHERSTDGDATYTFGFHPALAAQVIEEISVGLGHAEIIGYKLSSSARFNQNLELVVSRDRHGVYKLRLGLGRDNSATRFFEFENLDFMKLERFQVLKSFTEITESGHIWHPIMGEDESVKEVETIDLGQFSDLFEDRICKFNRKMHGLFAPGPLFISYGMSCDVPSAIVFEAFPKFDAHNLSMELKIYPEGGKPLEVIPQYLWKVGVTKNAEIGIHIIDVHLVTPLKHHQLNITLKTLKGNLEEHSLSVNIGVNGTYGFELYKRSWTLWQPDESIVTNSHRRKRDASFLTYLRGGKLSFGLVAWSPIPKYSKVNVLVGEFYGQHIGSAHIFLESDGLHPYLNSEFQCTTNYEPRNNVSISVAGVEYFPQFADWRQLSCGMENEALGKITWTLSMSSVEDERFELNDIYLIGGFELTYGRRHWHSISGDFTSLRKTLPGTYDEGKRNETSTWTTFGQNVVKGDVRFSQLPKLNFDYIYKINRLESDVKEDDNRNCENGYELKHVCELIPKSNPKFPKKFSYIYFQDYTKNGERDGDGCRLMSIRRTREVEFPDIVQWHYQTVERQTIYDDKIITIKLLEIQTNFIDKIFEDAKGALLHLKYQLDDEFDPFTKLSIEASLNATDDGPIFQTEHNFVRTSDRSIKYDGFYFFQPDYPLNTQAQRLDFDGVLETAYDRSWLLYKAFDIKIEDGQRNKSYTLSLHQIPDDSSKHFKVLLLGKHPMFDSSLKLLKMESTEGYKMSIKSTVPGFYDVRADAGDEILHFVLESYLQELKVQGKLGWPSSFRSTEDRTPYVVSAKVDANNLNTGQSVITFNSVSEFKYVYEETPTIIYFRTQDAFDKLPQNLQLTSRSTIKIIDDPQQSVDIFFQLHPHEEPERPVLSVSHLSKNGEKYLIQISTQASHHFSSPNQSSMAFGKWLRLERPSVLPFTLSKVVTFLQKKWNSDKLGGKDVLFDGFADIKSELKMEHHGFFCSGLDTDFQSNVEFGFKSAHWVENGTLSFINTSQSVYLDVAVKSEGRHSLPETKLSTSVTKRDWWFNKTDVVYGAHFTVSGGRVDSLKLSHNVSRHPEDLSRFLRSSGGSEISRLENAFREFIDSNDLNDKTTEIGWSLVQGVEGDESENVVSEGTHRFNIFFENYRNFEWKANHDVDCFLGDHKWEDKFYSKYPSFLEGACGLSSSKLFSVSSNKKSNRKEAVVELRYPMLRSKINATYTITEPSAEDPFRYTKLTTKGSSVLLEEDALMEIDSGKLFGPYGDEYKTHFFYKAFTYYEANFTSYMKHFNGSTSELFGELTTHNATLIYRLNPYNDKVKTEWNSVSAILHHGSAGNDPIFLHYDYGKRSVRLSDDGVEYPDGRKSHVSFSSVSGPPQQLVHIHSKNIWEFQSGKSRTDIYELIFRLGRLVDEDGLDCSATELSGHLGKSLKIEDVANLYKSKLHCDQCRPSEVYIKSLNKSQILDCKDSVGHFLLQSIIVNDTLNALTLQQTNLPESVWDNDMVQAVWTDDASCSMKRVEFHPFQDIDRHDVHDEVCTSALKEMGGCWTGLKEANCDTSAQSNGVKLWKRIVSKMNPVTISATMDPVWIFIQLIIP